MAPLFSIQHKDTGTSARTGTVTTGHGTFQTPCFMPVGTQGTVKTLTPEELETCGARVILSNTYYLYLRPGDALVREAGGLHRFMNWNGPILTDSGGYQVFSLADLRTITPEGVRFQSRIDGSYHLFTPESVIDIQRNLGADFVMPLDCPTAWPATPDEARQGHALTLQWAQQSIRHFRETQPVFSHPQYHFGIVQGAFDRDLRQESAAGLTALDFDGYAIGGLSVGEPKDQLYEMTAWSVEQLPENKLRYLMGVGKPEDLIECVSHGVDMFDCVLPTRNGRRGWVFTRRGRIVLKNAKYKNDFRPLDESCSCYACRNFSRAYLRHLFMAKEMLAPRMASLCNLHFYQALMAEMREAIAQNRFTAWRKNFLDIYHEED